MLHPKGFHNTPYLKNFIQDCNEVSLEILESNFQVAIEVFYFFEHVVRRADISINLYLSVYSLEEGIVVLPAKPLILMRQLSVLSAS